MNENEFLDKTKSTLNQYENELDAKTLARLNEARYRALHPEEVESRGRSWFAWGGAGSLATASIVAAFWLMNPVSSLNVPGDNVVEEYVNASEIPLTEEAISDEDIAMLDNVEFVAWLMEQEEINAG